MAKNRKTRAGNTLRGEAGVHFVASELYRRGMIALPTSGNTPGVDLVVMRRDGNKLEFRALEVKTTLNPEPQGFWPLSAPWTTPAHKDFFYAFVRRCPGKRESLEAFIVPSTRVDKERTATRGKWKGSWYLPKDARKAGALRDGNNLWKR